MVKSKVLKLIIWLFNYLIIYFYLHNNLHIFVILMNFVNIIWNLCAYKKYLLINLLINLNIYNLLLTVYTVYKLIINIDDIIIQRNGNKN